MHSGSQQCVNVASCQVTFTAITRVQIPSGTPNNRINDLRDAARSGIFIAGNAVAAKESRLGPQRFGAPVWQLRREGA